MEFDFPIIVNGWEINGKFKNGMYKAYKGNRTYMCEIIPCSIFATLNFIGAYKNYDRKINFLQIINESLYKHSKNGEEHIFILYEKALILKETGNFDTEKITNFIIEMARFHYKTGYCLTLDYASNLFVIDDKIYVKPTDIKKRVFDEKRYIVEIAMLFEMFNEKNISEKFYQLNELTHPENKTSNI